MYLLTMRGTEIMNNIKKRLKDVEERIKANEIPKIMVCLKDGTELQVDCLSVIKYLTDNKDKIEYVESGCVTMNTIYNALII